MKWTRITMVALLLAILSCGSSIVKADDPPDEDTAIVVEVIVVGDNTEFYLNGESIPDIQANIMRALAQPGVYPGSEGVEAWHLLRNTVLPWMQATEGYVGLTASGVSKLIVELGEQESQIIAIEKEIGNDLTHELMWNRASIETQKDRLTIVVPMLSSQISKLDANYIALSELENTRYIEMQAQIATLEQEVAQQHQLSFLGYEFDATPQYIVWAIIALIIVAIGSTAGLAIAIRRR